MNNKYEDFIILLLCELKDLNIYGTFSCFSGLANSI